MYINVLAMMDDDRRICLHLGYLWHMRFIAVLMALFFCAWGLRRRQDFWIIYY